MTSLTLLALALVAALAIYFAVGAVRRRRTPSELRGDWWTAFEREFRSYAKRAAGSPRQGERRRGPHGSAGR
jgi:hypothetical protein